MDCNTDLLHHELRHQEATTVIKYVSSTCKTIGICSKRGMETDGPQQAQQKTHPIMRQLPESRSGVQRARNHDLYHGMARCLPVTLLCRHILGCRRSHFEKDIPRDKSIAVRTRFWEASSRSLLTSMLKVQDKWKLYLQRGTSE